MANSVETRYIARTGVVTISTANPNLDGTGSLGTIITGAGSGTLVKTLIIKAQTDTSQGMIRLFAKKASGSAAVLLSEYDVLPIIKSERDLSFSNVIALNYKLESGEELKVSTEQGDTFNVFAEAFDLNYSSSTEFIGSSMEQLSNAGAIAISTANPNLNGTGTLVKLLTANVDWQGCCVTSIIIAAQQTTDPGVVRFFIEDDSSNIFLLSEVLIPSSVQGNSIKSFSYQVIGHGGLCLAPGYTIKVSTEKANSFGITGVGSDWKYV